MNTPHSKLTFKILLLSGPQNPWMIMLYAEHVPHPMATVYGSDLFESGLIPSDTDFRVFRDFGGLPGENWKV